MDKKTAADIMAMWNVFPQSNAKDLKAALSTYRQQLETDGISDRAAQEACKNFQAGTVEGQGFTFAPSMPEFMREARRIQDVLPLRDINRIAAPIEPYRSTGPAPFQIKQQQALDRFRGRDILHKNVSFDEFKHMSKAGELPVGATWSAALGTVYAKA
jgi:hypothetical protein